MAGSSPSDLVVAFRSFPRRLREALAQAEGDAERTRAAEAEAGELGRLVQDVCFFNARAYLGLELGTAARGVEPAAV